MLASYHGFTQVIDQPTRTLDIFGHKNNLLDLLLTTNEPTKISARVSQPLWTSNHHLISNLIDFETPLPLKAHPRRVWNYTESDTDGLRNYFRLVLWRLACCLVEQNADLTELRYGEIDKYGMQKFIPNRLITLTSLKLNHGSQWNVMRRSGVSVPHLTNITVIDHQQH
jgi:hypothetical protein